MTWRNIYADWPRLPGRLPKIRRDGPGSQTPVPGTGPEAGADLSGSPGRGQVRGGGRRVLPPGIRALRPALPGAHRQGEGRLVQRPPGAGPIAYRTRLRPGLAGSAGRPLKGNQDELITTGFLVFGAVFGSAAFSAGRQPPLSPVGRLLRRRPPLALVQLHKLKPLFL